MLPVVQLTSYSCMLIQVVDNSCSVWLQLIYAVIIFSKVSFFILYTQKQKVRHFQIYPVCSLKMFVLGWETRAYYRQKTNRDQRMMCFQMQTVKIFCKSCFLLQWGNISNILGSLSLNFYVWIKTFPQFGWAADLFTTCLIIWRLIFLSLSDFLAVMAPC